MSELETTLRFIDLRAMVRPSSLRGKFLLVSFDEQFYLIVAPIEDFPYHAHILAYFCDERKISVKFNQNRDMVTLEDERVKTYGGGWWERKSDASMVFYGKSQAYGPFDKSLLVGLGEDLPLRWSLDEPNYSI